MAVSQSTSSTCTRLTFAASNLLLPYDPDEEKHRKKQRKSCPDACRAYNIEGWEHIDKDSIAEDIGAGNWRKYGREAVFEYCEEDVRKSTTTAAPNAARLCRDFHLSMCRAYCIGRIIARSALRAFKPAASRSTWPLWNLVQENKGAVVGELLRRFDPSHGSDDPIYTPDGMWSYARFERWLPSVGITDWPRLESGALDIPATPFA